MNRGIDMCLSLIKTLARHGCNGNGSSLLCERQGNFRIPRNKFIRVLRNSFIVVPRNLKNGILGWENWYFPFVLYIIGEQSPSMIPLVREVSLQTKQISTLQLQKGLKKSCTTFLAVLKKEGGEISYEVPKKITYILEEFKDVMLRELPKKLPPKREMDHKIELEHGSTPPSVVPYRVAPPDLEELRRQFKELLDTGYI